MGLSDETEAERWAKSLGGVEGVGDESTFATIDTDLADLGLH